MSDQLIITRENNEDGDAVFSVSIPVTLETVEDLETMCSILERQLSNRLYEMLEEENRIIEKEFLYGTGENHPVGFLTHA